MLPEEIWCLLFLRPCRRPAPLGGASGSLHWLSYKQLLWEKREPIKSWRLQILREEDVLKMNAFLVNKDLSPLKPPNRPTIC